MPAAASAPSASPVADAAVLTADQVRLYREHGVVLLPSIVPAAHVALLRGGCQAAMDRVDRELEAKGTDVAGINHRGKRYFAANPSRHDPELFAFIASPQMAGICRALLGDEVWVFWEQYVVKGAEEGMSFSWHQDSGYVAADTPHKPYLTCWVALDDMSEANGTAYILPMDRSGIRARVEHARDPQTNDMIGYFGADPGDPVLCAAGSIACFTSVTFHRSGWNRTQRMRRSYLIQYSCEEIRKRDGSPWGRTERLLDGGRIVLPVPA